MELDQWLGVYQALVRSAATKEQSGWSLHTGGLTAQSILAIAAIFLVFIEPMPLAGLRFFLVIGLVTVGLISSTIWLVMQKRIQAEATHLNSLVRSIESQFAGAEFFRSLCRFSKGEQICVPGSDWTCNEWLPSVSRLPLFARLAPASLAGLVTLSFVLGWIALLVRVLTL